MYLKKNLSFNETRQVFIKSNRYFIYPCMLRVFLNIGKFQRFLTNREYRSLSYHFILCIFEKRLFHEVHKKSDWSIYTERMICITLSKSSASWYEKERNLTLLTKLIQLFRDSRTLRVVSVKEKKGTLSHTCGKISADRKWAFLSRDSGGDLGAPCDVCKQN